MRLIDADALIEEARELHIDDFMLVMAMANKQPTAYDAEKVVAELEKLKTDEYYKSVEGNRDSGIRNNAYANAIDIVKAGGVE